MRWNPETRVKKLALAYQTGWEYTPHSREAGSVLTDIFLDMMRDNRQRYENIWEKHRQEFLAAMPPQDREARRLKTGLAVRASGGSHGGWLARQTGVYMAPEEGDLLRFTVQEDIQLTAAKLRYAVYQKGLCAWLTYEGGVDKGQDAFGIPLFQETGTELSHPVFCWRFRDLCNGRTSVRFELEPASQGDSALCGEDGALLGNWKIGDGTNTYPLEWTQSEGQCLLEGFTPAFAGNLEETQYEICLEIPAEEELGFSWLETLSRGICLIEEGVCREPELCLTAAGVGDGERLLPFTDAPETAACCYLACDSVMAVKGREVTLKFTENYETEEKAPPGVSKEYRKLYKKYPWLKSMEIMQEWGVRETLWEYFDGSFWRKLPGSDGWETGCRPEKKGEHLLSWTVPRDMRPCSIEGEEHYYIRLRLVRADNAYAAYYHKIIPVLEHIRFVTGSRRIEPKDRELPDISEAGQKRMYLGFDREITCHNRWYTDSGRLEFSPGQIRGRQIRFGREAFWVELECREPVTLSALYANYVEILELMKEGEPKAADLQLPAGTAFHVETDRMGVLDAVSVYDARYDGRGTVLWEEMQWRESYPACSGRMISVMDMDLLLQRSYLFIRVVSCSYIEKSRELTVVLEQQRDCGESPVLQKLLPEIQEWLEETLRYMGLLWLSDCHVNCMEKEEMPDGKITG